jgi:hypothetical protein
VVVLKGNVVSEVPKVVDETRVVPVWMEEAEELVVVLKRNVVSEVPKVVDETRVVPVWMEEAGLSEMLVDLGGVNELDVTAIVVDSWVVEDFIS